MFKIKSRIKITICFALIALLASSTGVSGQSISQTNSKPPILLGTYLIGWLDQGTLDQYVNALDEWAGKKSSLVGLVRYFDNSTTTVSSQLDIIWNNGFTPFVHMEFVYEPRPTAYQIANGDKDGEIANWAQAIASWTSGGKWLYLAPLPEMNTKWASYGQDPENYKLAFARIRNIFSQYGVSDSDVKWVFAPNGWAHLVFEPYYPGDDLVDVVGFSARNKGYCESNSDAWYWSLPATSFGFNLRNFFQMAPDKPIFITGVGTTAETAHDVPNTDAKNQWLKEAYDYLAVQYGVQAVIYYNYSPSWECDWAIYDDGDFAYEGYKWGIANERYGYLTQSELAQTDMTPSLSGTSFTPIVNMGVTGSEGRILLGMYTQKWPGLQRVIVDEVKGLNNWSGKHISILGTFVDFTSIAIDEIELQLEVIRENGYVPFLNLNTNNDYFTAKRIAQGEADTYLRAVARSFALFAKGGKQMAYVAPLYEMNADFNPYSGDPANFILAYKRIQQIFTEEGVPENSVAWVWSPNGTSSPGTPELEYYYPGDEFVEYVGFTAYNFGYCDGIADQFQGWNPPEVAIGTYLNQLTELAADKKIIVSQTGTTAMTQYGIDHTAKNNWLSDMYEYLSGFSQLHAIMYYNRWISDCDWAVFNPNGIKYTNYSTGVSNPVYGYFTPFHQTEFFVP